MVLNDLKGSRCFVFLDGIFVYTKSLAEYDAKIRQVLVFDRIRERNLKLKSQKCEFLRKEVSYLGHVISENGVLSDKTKTNVIEKFSTPKTVKQLRFFLRLMSYYRSFIPRFSQLASPLHKLVKKDTRFEWINEQEQIVLGTCLTAKAR